MNTKTWVMNLGGIVLAPGLLYANDSAVKTETIKKSEKIVPSKVVSIKSRATA